MGIEAQEADMASSGKGVDVRGEVVNLFLEKIASDRNPSVTMMNMVEELLTPDDVPAYVGVLMDKVKRSAAGAPAELSGCAIRLGSSGATTLGVLRS
jgi:hypothetical protein